MDRLSGGERTGRPEQTGHPGSGAAAEDVPVLADAATGITPARRWAADPLTLLAVVGATGLAVTTLALLGGLTGTAAWVVPALFGVVVAGLALSGST